jgi:hypothetical protein
MASVMTVTVFLPCEQNNSHDGVAFDLVTLTCARGQKPSTVTKLSLKVAQNRPNLPNSKRPRLVLTDDWQRELVEFSIRWGSGIFALANRCLQPLGHLCAGFALKSVPQTRLQGQHENAHVYFLGGEFFIVLVVSNTKF